jgi:hypothetical protein
MIQRTIDRLRRYQYMADFGTCAVSWPLLDQWEQDILAGKPPILQKPSATKPQGQSRH